MRSYLLFNSTNKLPKWRDVLTFIFDESFRKRPYCGFGRSYSNNKICYDNYHWGKWEDNPNIPMYAHGTTLWVLYFPFKEKVSELIIGKMQEYGFKYAVQFRLEKYKPALIDHRAYHRLVYKYANSTNGLIFSTTKNKLLNAKEYYHNYKEIIDRKFNIHPSKKDLIFYT